MERIIRQIFCETLKKDVKVAYTISEFGGVNGNSLRKKIMHYDCEFKRQCEEEYSVFECTCFKGIRRVEQELNNR